MPFLVYWFDKSIETGVPYVTMVPNSSILSYEFGEKLYYDQCPKSIARKLIRGEPLTDSEKIICDAIVAMDGARESRARPVEVQPDDALYKTVRAQNTITTNVTTNVTTTDASMQMVVGLQPKEQPSLQLSPEHEHEPPGMPKVGDRVKVWWQSEKSYYYGCIVDARQSFYFIVYDDEETQWLPLADHTFTIVPHDEDDEDTLPSSNFDSDTSWRTVPSIKLQPAVKSLLPAKLKATNAIEFADGENESEWDCSDQNTEPLIEGKPKYRLDNGVLSMIKNPEMNDQGFYICPRGRPPMGYEWE